MKISNEVYKEKENILREYNRDTCFDNIATLVMHDEIERIIDDLSIKEYTVKEILTFVKLFRLCVEERLIGLKRPNYSLRKESNVQIHKTE